MNFATTLKPILLLITLALLLLPACDNGEHPLKDPTEMYEKAVALIKEKSFKEANPLLEDAARSFRELKKTDKLAEALTFLVQTKLELGEFREAFTVSAEAIALMRKEGDVHGEVRIAILEGDLYKEMQMFDLAIGRYRNATASAVAFDDKIASSDAQIKLADILKINDDLDEALEVYKNVLIQAQAIGNQQHIAEALGGIGGIYRLQQRHVEALNSLTQGLASINEARDPLVFARLQTEIGLLHLDRNDVNAALRDFRDAINTLRLARTGKEYETVLLFRLGHLYEQKDRLLEAKKYYSEALEIARSRGDYIAESYLSIFLARCNFSLTPKEEREQNREKLRQSYEEIARKFQECSHITGEGYLYAQIGKDFEAKGDLLKAREFYSKAVALDQYMLAEYFSMEFHSLYQTALKILPSRIDWYELLSGVLIKLQRQDEALKTIESGRMRQYASTFQKLNIFLRHPKLKLQTRELRVQIQKTRVLELEYTARLSGKQHSSDYDELSALRNEIESDKQEIGKGSSQIIGEYPNYETLVLPGRVETTTLRKYLPSGMIAIEFMPADDRLYIFVLTPSQLVVRTSKVRRESLFRLMSEYKSLLHDPAVYSGEAGEASITSMTRFAILSTKLYDLLLRPIDDLFEQGIIIVENSDMERFPFHALERQDSGGNIRYLIEITSVDYLPSLASLRYRTSSTVRLRKVVAFGNPTGKNWSVDYELRDIRSFYKSAAIMVGLEASWDNFKSVKADILQVSTQFVQSNAEFLLGNVVFSNGLIIEQSTTVPFEKFAELDAIPVIILSNQFGQGMGLSTPHALLLRLNGTSEVFFNAWIADRKSAKFFSEYFFTHLSNGLAPGDAYRQALLNLIRTREVSQPHSWAQFYHFGTG